MVLAPLQLDEMRIVFVGARVVGHRVLEALLQAGANIVGVLTLDEAKREMTTAFTPFDDLSDQYQLNARKFTSLKDPELTEWVQQQHPDLGIVVGVSQLVGEKMLVIPPRGFIGMHPTMLPEGRGRAPIPWALIKGLEKTGATLFYCDPKADTGDLLAQQEVPIYYEDVSSTLGSRTDTAVIELFLDNLPKLADGTAPRFPQDEEKATVWPQRRPEDGLIDWWKSSRELYNWVRALTHPYPGAFTFWNGHKLFVWEVREVTSGQAGKPGEVLALQPDGVLVATRDGALLLTQLAGERGNMGVGIESLAVGDCFESFVG
jgi:methionyl-tRNA formyltransferase